MARIRAIKPEFWSSPNLPADPWARLLYMAMWNWADDCGVGTANPRELLGFAFPNDDDITVADLRRMLVEIRRAFDVTFYTVAGRPYFAIPPRAWEKHQKFDRRSQGKHPGPEHAETFLYTDTPDQQKPTDSWESHEHSTDTRGNPTSTRRDAGAGTEEQGNRGTEEPPYPPRAEPSPPRATRPRGGRAVAEALNRTAHSPEAHSIARDYERRVGKVPGDVLSKIAQSIDGCLQSGYEPEQIHAGLDAWADSDMVSPTTIPSFVLKSANRAANPTTSKPPGLGTAGTSALAWVESGRRLAAQQQAALDATAHIAGELP